MCLHTTFILVSLQIFVNTIHNHSNFVSSVSNI